MADSKSIILLQSFIKEKLGGDIRKLRDFDLCSLEEDRKYGSTNYADAPIIKAILTLAYSDKWPDLSYDNITRGAFECDKINKIEQLFGFNMNFQYFKGMQKFNPSPSQQQRAIKVTHMCGTIGNFWVLPKKESIVSCILDNGYRYYMDKFLKSIYAILTQKKRVDGKLKSAIESNKRYFDKYQGEEGFKSFVTDMMLEDFVDYYGKPEETFMFVWSAMKDLDRTTYFKAVDQFCAFCEKFIPNRGDKIIAKLESVLSGKMDDQPICTTILPKRKPANDGENKTLRRYDLAFNLMNDCIDVIKGDFDRRLPLLAEEGYFRELCDKMGLVPDGFEWDDFYISVERYDDITLFFYGFPIPQREPEAIYGALMIDLNNKSLKYYTLEMCRNSGLWALGLNSKGQHSLMGMYNMEPTKENFLKLIVPKEKLLPEIDIKALFQLPAEYKVLSKTPAAPMYCVNYGMKTTCCNSIIQAFPVIPNCNMKYYDVPIIINGINQSLDDNSALIEVNAGKTISNRQYSYSIIKIKNNPSGVIYYLIMFIAYGNVAINIKGDFIEAGMTGIRDTTIWELARRKGLVSITDNSGWCFDPYDKNSKRSYLMNLSEKEEYDEMFPDHPLSQCRKFVKLIIQRL